MIRTGSSNTELSQSIWRWQIGVGIYVGLIFFAYVGWFAVKLGNGLSAEASSWGQAGDFIGGLLNPVVALAAFFWLTKGVELQKQELSETREALAGAMEAQKEQADHASTTVRLQALTALFNAASNEVESLRAARHFMVSQVDQNRGGVRTQSGDWVRGDASAAIKTLNEDIELATNMRDEYRKGISRIFSKQLMNEAFD